MKGGDRIALSLFMNGDIKEEDDFYYRSQVEEFTLVGQHILLQDFPDARRQFQPGSTAVAAHKDDSLARSVFHGAPKYVK